MSRVIIVNPHFRYMNHKFNMIAAILNSYFYIYFVNQIYVSNTQICRLIDRFEIFRKISNSIDIEKMYVI